jgi:hypothetical protein
MNQWIVLAALVVTLALSALLVSAYTFIHAQRLFHRAAAAAEEIREECAASLRATHASLAGMISEVRESSYHIPAEPLPGAVRTSMNLTRRSQALRLHRKGESPQRIAESLRAPRQEVDLLLKVSEIVLHNFLPGDHPPAPAPAAPAPIARPLRPDARLFTPAPGDASALAPPNPQ